MIFVEVRDLSKLDTSSKLSSCVAGPDDDGTKEQNRCPGMGRACMKVSRLCVFFTFKGFFRLEVNINALAIIHLNQSLSMVLRFVNVQLDIISIQKLKTLKLNDLLVSLTVISLRLIHAEVRNL